MLSGVFIIAFFILYFPVLVMGGRRGHECCLKNLLIGHYSVYFSPLYPLDDDDVTTSGVTLDDVDKRVIFLNRPQPQKFSTNHISTAKYRLVMIIIVSYSLHVMRKFFKIPLKTNFDCNRNHLYLQPYQLSTIVSV